MDKEIGLSIIKGTIPEDIVTGIINLFAGRNKPEHDKVMDMATYLGHFALTAKAISFFSNTSLPKGIQIIIDGKRHETKNGINSVRESNKVDLNDEVSSPSPMEDNSYRKKGISADEDIGKVKVEVYPPYYYGKVYNLKFNNFPVSVTYEFTNLKGTKKENGIVYLLPKSEKSSKQYRFLPINIMLNVKKI